MAVLGDHGALTQRELTQQTLMDKVPVNRACKRLEDRGLVLRSPNASDGRSHLLELHRRGSFGACGHHAAGDEDRRRAVLGSQ